MKRCVSRFSVALVVMPFFLLFFAASSPAADSIIKLKFGTFFPPTHPHSLLYVDWCKEVEKRTDGRVKVAFFPAGTLVSANQTYDGVVKGIVDIGLSIMSYTPGRMPLSEVIVLPLGYKSGAQASKMANAFYQQFKPK